MFSIMLACLFAVSQVAVAAHEGPMDDPSHSDQACSFCLLSDRESDGDLDVNNDNPDGSPDNDTPEQGYYASLLRLIIVSDAAPQRVAPIGGNSPIVARLKNGRSPRAPPLD